MDLPALNLDDDSAALTGTLAGALQALTRHTTVYRTLLHFCNVVS